MRFLNTKESLSLGNTDVLILTVLCVLVMFKNGMSTAGVAKIPVISEKTSEYGSKL